MDLFVERGEDKTVNTCKPHSVYVFGRLVKLFILCLSVEKDFESTNCPPDVGLSVSLYKDNNILINYQIKMKIILPHEHGRPDEESWNVLGHRGLPINISLMIIIK